MRRFQDLEVEAFRRAERRSELSRGGGGRPQAGVAQALFEALVARAPEQAGAVPAVQARVAGMGPKRRTAVAVEQQHHDGGAHVCRQGAGNLLRNDRLVGPLDQSLAARSADLGMEREGFEHMRHGRARCRLAAAMPTRAVAQHRDQGTGPFPIAERIFVALAPPGLRQRGERDGQCAPGHGASGDVGPASVSTRRLGFVGAQELASEDGFEIVIQVLEQLGVLQAVALPEGRGAQQGQAGNTVRRPLRALGSLGTQPREELEHRRAHAGHHRDLVDQQVAVRVVQAPPRGRGSRGCLALQHPGQGFGRVGRELQRVVLARRDVRALGAHVAFRDRAALQQRQRAFGRRTQQRTEVFHPVPA